MQEAQEAERKCEFAKYEPYVWSLRIAIEPIQITSRIIVSAQLQFLSSIKYFTIQLSMFRDRLDIVNLLIYLLYISFWHIDITRY